MSDSVAVAPRARGYQKSVLPWLVCLSAGLFFFYEFFQLNVFDVINQPLRKEFHLDATKLSWMSSTYLWANILFLLPAGMILDRYSTRVVILWAMSVCVLSTVGFALTTSFTLASFFHFLSGIGNAFCFVACVILVSRWFEPCRQALVIGCVVTMAFIGGMMAHTPLAYLNRYYGWRHALLIDGVLGIGLFIWIYFTVQDKPSAGDDVASEKLISSRPRLLRVLMDRQNWLAGIYTSCLNLPIMVLCALWGASYLQVVHHLSPIEASNVVSLIFIGSIMGCPLSGWLSDLMRRRKPLMIMGATATLLTLIPLFWGVALSLMQLSMVFFSLGFFTSTQVISYPLVAESNSQHNTGLATSIASVIIMGGGGIGQVIFGMLMEYHTPLLRAPYTVDDFQCAMWVFPMAGLIALLSMFLIRETNCQRCE